MNESKNVTTVGYINEGLKDICKESNETFVKFSFQCFQEQFLQDIHFRVRFFNYLIVIFLTVFFNIFLILTNTNLKETIFSKITSIWRRNNNAATANNITHSILYYKTRASFVSNACADLTVGGFVMVFMMIQELFGHWPFSPNLCILWSTLDFVCGSSSMLHMCVIAFDRLMSLKNPLKANNLQVAYSNVNMKLAEFRNHIFKLVSAWLIAALFWIPLVVPVLNTQIKEHFKTCEISLKYYIVIPHSFLVYFLPMVTIVALYVTSYVYLRRTVKNLGTNVKVVVNNTKKSTETQIKRTSSTENVSESNANNANTKFNQNPTSQERKLSYMSSECEQNDFGKSDSSSRSNKPSFIKASDCINETFTLNSTIVVSDRRNESVLPTSDKNFFKERFKNLKKQLVFNHAGRLRKSTKRKSNTTMNIANNEMRIMKRLAFITGSFLLCWLPWIIVWNYVSVKDISSISSTIYVGSFWMAYLNSLINPVAIILTSTRYQAKIKNLYTKIFSKFRRISQTPDG